MLKWLSMLVCMMILLTGCGGVTIDENRYKHIGSDAYGDFYIDTQAITYKNKFQDKPTTITAWIRQVYTGDGLKKFRQEAEAQRRDIKNLERLAYKDIQVRVDHMFKNWLIAGVSCDVVRVIWYDAKGNKLDEDNYSLPPDYKKDVYTFEAINNPKISGHAWAKASLEYAEKYGRKE